MYQHSSNSRHAHLALIKGENQYFQTVNIACEYACFMGNSVLQ